MSRKAIRLAALAAGGAFLCAQTSVIAREQRQGKLLGRDMPAQRLRTAAASGPEQQLPEVKVRPDSAPLRSELPSPYPGGQVARGGRLGLFGNVAVMDAPFSITTYTAKIVEDQQARRLSDVLANDPAVRLSSAPSNINEDFSIRGFPVTSADVALNGMFGLMPHFRVPVEMVERIEVLKGPTALFNGMAPSGNIGGAINVVPKRAGAEPLTRFTASHASASNFGGHLDLSRRFGDSRKFGVRFNGVHRDGDTAIDKQSQRDKVGAAALDYAGERVRVSADLIHQVQDIDRVVRQLGIGAGLAAVPSAPDSNLNYPGYGRSRTEDNVAVLRGELDLSEAATLYAGIGQRKHEMDAVAGNAVLLNTAGDFTSTPAWQVFRVQSTSAEAGIDLRLRTGAVGHRIALGATRVEQKSDIYFLFAGLAPARNSSLYAPVYASTPDTSAFSANTVDYNDTTLTSFAAADTLAFLDDRVLLTLGARHQRVEAQAYDFTTGARSGPEYDAHKVTPVAGVVVKPWQNVSIYASYIEGLSQGPSAPIGAVNASQIFAPIQTKQYETGVKADWGRIAATLALFQITRPSAFSVDGVFGVNGEQRNRGAELALFGEAVRGARVLGGLAYTKGELTRTENGAFDGNEPIAVPRMQVNLGIEWDAPFAPGVTFTARTIHTGRQYIDQANELPLPKWTRVDLGARYQTRIQGRNVVFRVSLENAFDKNHWGAANAGFLYVGAPRTFLFSAAVDL